MPCSRKSLALAMFYARAALSGILPQEWTTPALEDSSGPSSPLTESSSHPSCPASSPSTKAYDPDLDDYDMRTAPVLPPTPAQLEDEWKQRQIRALEGRIAKGGDEAVLNHYRKVVSELRAPCIQKRKLCHVRNSSTSSTCTMSTVFPEDAADLEFDGAEEEEEHEEVEEFDVEAAIPQEESSRITLQTSAAQMRTTLESKRQTEDSKSPQRGGDDRSSFPVAANCVSELFPVRHRLTYAMACRAMFMAVLDEPSVEGTAGWFGL